MSEIETLAEGGSAERWIVDQRDHGAYFLKTASGTVVREGLSQRQARQVANEHNGDQEYPDLGAEGGGVMTINDFRGTPHRLSDEVYVLGSDPTSIPFEGYTEGVEVRLISGVDEYPIPGYHFMQGFVTVCRVDADHAEFIGVRKQALKLR